MRDVPRILVSVSILAGVLITARLAGAVEWAEPTGIPPSANPPGFVWTRAPSGPVQPGGQFNIAGAGKIGGLLESLGGAVFGSATLNLGGEEHAGRNVIYGVAKWSGMTEFDSLLLLETAADDGTRTRRLSVDSGGGLTTSGSIHSPEVRGDRLCIVRGIDVNCRDSWPAGTITGITPGYNMTGGGTTGNVTIGIRPTPSFGALSIVKTGDPPSSGNLTVAGCLGPVFKGRSTESFQGNIGGSPGYLSANLRCNATLPGSHVCTTAEVLNSINCSAIAAIDLAETDMWIANLAPSLPTPTNDCVGWTTASSDWWGIKWRFNKDTGGGAFAERCSTSLPFACCR